MQILTDDLIKACANVDVGARQRMAEAFDRLRLTMMEKLVDVDEASVAEYRGGIRVLKQLVHVMSHAPHLARQIEDTRRARTG